MLTHNRQVRLVQRPDGDIKPDCFELERTEVPGALQDGQVLVQVRYISMDPTNRLWMSDMEQYMPPVQLGDTMRGFGLGRVVKSRSSRLPEGTLVSGMLGWQDYVVVGDGAVPAGKIRETEGIELSAYLGVLGLSGLTAYAGVHFVGCAKPGETMVVSGAAGAVGSLAGQLAKTHGCRVVGIASGDKRDLLLDLGFDSVVDRRSPDWREQLSDACPDGIDVDFENVGGEILDHILTLLNDNARVALCGLMSQYNNGSEEWYRLRNAAFLLWRTARIEGFLTGQFTARFSEALADLREQVKDGRLRAHQTVIRGLESTPEASSKHYDGSAVGKLVVHVSDEDGSVVSSD